MTRVIVADGCHQLDSPLTGRRYYARGARAFEGTVRGGVFDMHPRDAQLAVAMGGAVVPAGGVVMAPGGYRCSCCRFLGYFASCSRCERRGCQCGGTQVRAEGGASARAMAAAVDPDPPAEEAADAPAEGEAAGGGEEGSEDQGGS